ncbi:MAG: GntR family transcriptional regulator [Candidatus Atribacteria bacterium]|nr:GntR family transcriptional regulator [Candidatus Atribacteria bacterium]MCD6349766.1 GntR family transcriptional regulator [Candidatus Atribacteria bacterium]
MNTTKKEVAYKEIKALILGSREKKEKINLSENFLVKKLKMSRTPIREALQRLQLEGLIKIIPQKGIVIQDILVEEIREIYDIRIALEEFVVREIAPLIKDEDICQLESLLKEQAAYLDPPDPVNFHKADREFHSYLLKLYGNSMIQEFMSNLRDRIYLANLSLLKSRENIRLFYEEHIRIKDALKERDGKKAALAMDIHLKGGKMRLMNL